MKPESLRVYAALSLTTCCTAFDLKTIRNGLPEELKKYLPPCISALRFESCSKLAGTKDFDHRVCLLSSYKCLEQIKTAPRDAFVVAHDRGYKLGLEEIFMSNVVYSNDIEYIDLALENMVSMTNNILASAAYGSLDTLKHILSNSSYADRLSSVKHDMRKRAVYCDNKEIFEYLFPRRSDYSRYLFSTLPMVIFHDAGKILEYIWPEIIEQNIDFVNLAPLVTKFVVRDGKRVFVHRVQRNCAKVFMNLASDDYVDTLFAKVYHSESSLSCSDEDINFISKLYYSR